MTIKDRYYGLYRSSTTSTTGCVKEFITHPKDNMLFPPQVQYKCDLCNVEHGFRFIMGHITATPKQIKSFIEYCVAKGIEQEVEID